MVLEDLFCSFIFLPVHNTSTIFLPVHIHFYLSKWRVDGSLHKAMLLDHHVLVVAWWLRNTITTTTRTTLTKCRSRHFWLFMYLRQNSQMYITDMSINSWKKKNNFLLCLTHRFFSYKWKPAFTLTLHVWSSPSHPPLVGYRPVFGVSAIFKARPTGLSQSSYVRVK